jgi:hypothetical protein
MSILSVFIAAAIGAIVFTASLVIITYASAWLADVTGVFRLLFIKRPYSQAFRLARWASAGVTTLVMLTMID